MCEEWTKRKVDQIVNAISQIIYSAADYNIESETKNRLHYNHTLILYDFIL